MKDKPNKVTAVLKVVVTGEFYDDEASEETLRYCVEQDLEDAGFDVDVALLKEETAKPPIHVHKEYPEHDWRRNEDGKIDEFAYDGGYHNGPMCKRCYYSFCMHCNPDGWNEEPCIIDKYKCPKCGRHIGKGTKFCSDCGQAVKWDG